MTAKLVGTFAPPVARWVSITVPAAVPSLCHTWKPEVVVYAVKYRIPFSAVRLMALDPDGPPICVTGVVPAAVPSLVHTCVPCTPSLAVKYSVLPTTVRLLGRRPPPPTLP